MICCLVDSCIFLYLFSCFAGVCFLMCIGCPLLSRTNDCRVIGTVCSFLSCCACCCSADPFVGPSRRARRAARRSYHLTAGQASPVAHTATVGCSISNPRRSISPRSITTVRYNILRAPCTAHACSSTWDKTGARHAGTKGGGRLDFDFEAFATRYTLGARIASNYMVVYTDSVGNYERGPQPPPPSP